MLKQTYHLGIIDYLQEYNSEKKLESFLKQTYFAKEDSKNISCVPPELYQKRFEDFMNKNILVENIAS